MMWKGSRIRGEYILAGVSPDCPRGKLKSLGHSYYLWILLWNSTPWGEMVGYNIPFRRVLVVIDL